MVYYYYQKHPLTRHPLTGPIDHKQMWACSDEQNKKRVKMKSPLGHHLGTAHV